MPPVKEIHFFDRSPTYQSPNDLATPSFISRIIGKQPWQRERTFSGLSAIFRRIATGDLDNLLWWLRWNFGYYNTEWYLNLFTPHRKNQICGEITPSYSILNHDDIYEIKKINQHIKLIFIIRNPIERSWSAIRYYARNNPAIDLNSFEQIKSLIDHPTNNLRSNYEQTINRYLQHFPSSQLLICFYDAILADPLGLLQSIAKYLDISPFKENKMSFTKVVNPSPKQQMPEAIRAYLEEKYSPMINNLAKALGNYTEFWVNGYTASEKYTSMKPALRI